MKLIRKLIVAVILIVVVVVAVLLVSKDRVIRSRAISEVEAITGFPLEIDDLKIGLFSSRFELKGCRLMNPEEFEADEALVINEFSANVQLLSLLTSTVKFTSAVLDIPTLNIETSRDGVNNLELLQQRIKDYADSRPSSKDDGDKKPDDKKDSPKKKSEKSVYFEELTVRLGKGSMRDYSKGEDVASTELDLNLDKHYTEVDNVNEVLIDLTATVIQKTILGAIGNDLGGFIQDLTEGSEDAGIDLKEEAEKFEEQFKGLMKQFR